jgi:hypothetical protein
MNCSKAMDDRLQGSRDKFPSYFRANHSIQHNPLVADNLTSLGVGLRALATECSTHVHKVLGEGNFVLVGLKGLFGGPITISTESRAEKLPSIRTPSKPSSQVLNGRISTENAEPLTLSARRVGRPRSSCESTSHCRGRERRAHRKMKRGLLIGRPRFPCG